MRYLVLMICLLLSGLVRAEATAATAQETLASQYFEVSGLDKLYTDKDQVKYMMDSQLKVVEQSAEQNMSPADFTRFRGVLAKVRPSLDAGVARTLVQMRPELVQIVARSYSEAELKALVAFYNTPEGHSVVTKNPQVMSAMMEVAAKHTAVMLQDLQQNLIKALQESAGTGK